MYIYLPKQVTDFNLILYDASACNLKKFTHYVHTSCTLTAFRFKAN